jgi:hypothetical protein
MRHELDDRSSEMSPTQSDHPRETFFLDRPHKPLGERIRIGA